MDSQETSNDSDDHKNWWDGMRPDFIDRIKQLAKEYGRSENVVFKLYMDELAQKVISMVCLESANEKGELLSLSDLAKRIFKADSSPRQNASTSKELSNDIANSIQPLYQDLDRETNEIRLLRIQSSEELESPVHCSFFVVPLHDAPKFSAASYVWGDPSITEDIILNGVICPVTKNLSSALRFVRASGATSVCDAFWADAICINQKEVREKSHQVQLMSKIYESATLVISWLGCSFIKSDIVFEAVQRAAGAINEALQANGFDRVNINDLSTLKATRFSTVAEKWDWAKEIPSIFGWTELRSFPSEFDDLGERPSLRYSISSWLSETANSISFPWNEAYAGLISLGSNGYWTRGWTLPEMVLARTHILMHGHDILPADDLWTVLLFLDAISDSTSNSEHKYPKAQRMTFTTMVHILSHKRLGLQVTRNTPEAWAKRILLSLSTEVTEPKDKVYSLIGLAGEGLTVDYSASTRDVYASLCQIFLSPHAVEAKQYSLFFLSLSGLGTEANGKAQLGFPSWLPYFQGFGGNMHSPHCHGGICCDPSRVARVLPFFSSWRPTPKQKCDSTISQDNLVLSLSGITFDTIKSVPKMRTWTEILSFFFDFGISQSPAYPNGFPRLKALLQALHLYLLQGDDFSSTTPLAFRFATAFLVLLITQSLESGNIANPDRYLSELGLLPILADGSGEELAARLKDLVNERMLNPIPKTALSEDTTSPPVRTPIDQDSTLPSHSFIRQLNKMRTEFEAEIGAIRGAISVLSSGAHSLFVTQRGYLGFGPWVAEPGDIVCLPLGCHFPIVLRRIDDGYVHVGACYIVGIMSGELEESIQAGELKSSRFDIH